MSSELSWGIQERGKGIHFLCISPICRVGITFNDNEISLYELFPLILRRRDAGMQLIRTVKHRNTVE